MLQDYMKFKHDKEVPQEAEIQYLKQHLLAQDFVRTVLRILGALNTR
jgi:hypothetical protein